MRPLTQEEKTKLTHVIEEGMKVLQDVQDLREGLKDTVKAVAEELDVKPSIINKAIRTAYKRNLGEMQNDLTEIEELLETTGKKG
jgi:transposase-like protein